MSGTLLGVAGLGRAVLRECYRASLAKMVGTIFNNVCVRHALLIVTLVEGDVCAENPLSISDDSVVQKRKAWVQPGVGAHAKNQHLRARGRRRETEWKL